ncbi:MAG: hypothetical protein MZV65_26605 [Chromatiales bacterium]|nr:hypothetical protein [Chromatiales bacterium]
MKRQRNALKLLDAQTLARLAGESLRRLHPRRLAHNPVMFVVGVGTLVTLWLTGTDIIAGRPWGFDLAITLTLLFTLLFANAAEALAEAQGRAQAESLRSTRKQLVARRVRGTLKSRCRPRPCVAATGYGSWRAS